MEKIIKSFNGKLKHEIKSTGTFCYCSWERLKPLLDSAVMLKDGEQITGLIIDEDGISVRVE